MVYHNSDPNGINLISVKVVAKRLCLEKVVASPDLCSQEDTLIQI